MMLEILKGYLNAFVWTKPHIKEQAIHRIAQCSDCFEKGRCPHCGCLSPALFFSPTKKDKLGKWDKMMDKENWNRYLAEKTKYLLGGKTYNPFIENPVEVKEYIYDDVEYNIVNGILYIKNEENGAGTKSSNGDSKQSNDCGDIQESI